MTTPGRKASVGSTDLTVGELIDEFCRMSDQAVVKIRCSALRQQLKFHRIRKRSKGVVEIEVVACPESPSVVPATDAALASTTRS